MVAYSVTTRAGAASIPLHKLTIPLKILRCLLYCNKGLLLFMVLFMLHQSFHLLTCSFSLSSCCMRSVDFFFSQLVSSIFCVHEFSLCKLHYLTGGYSHYWKESHHKKPNIKTEESKNI